MVERGEMERRWRGFFRLLLGFALAFGLLLAAALVGLDPFGNIPFSPPLQRPMMLTNQRYMYPPLARSERFDSAVFGTSTVRLLNPARLNAAFGGTFAQLALNDGQAYEQYRLADLFLRNHPHARTLLFGVDIVWCREGENLARFSDRPFPTWMYDDNPWNDLLHLFNRRTLETGWRMTMYFLGHEEARYDPDGYKDFLPPQRDYDLAKVQASIYGAQGPQPVQPVAQPVRISREEREGWVFEALPWLEELLTKAHPDSEKILVFVPYHRYLQARPGSRQEAVWNECKSRVAGIAARYSNTHVLDFMIPSEITSRDTNYWDPLHYTVPIADRLVELIRDGVRDGRDRTGTFRVLAGNGRALTQRR